MKVIGLVIIYQNACVSDAGSNISPNDNNASNQNSGSSNPFDEDITLSGK